jgi:hypothetical protein
MPKKVLVVTTADAPQSQVEAVVRAHAGDDADAIDDAREDAARRAETAAADDAHAHVGDPDPLQAIEDALRIWPADEVVVLTTPEEDATWIESGLGERAQERFALPVTHLVAR